MKNKAIITVLLLLCFITVARSQAWLSRLPQKADKDMTFNDVQQAFRSFYGSDTARFMRENEKPTFSFSDEGGRQKKEMEEHKLFKRWEWLVEPRLSGQDRLDMQRITALKAAVPAEDKELILKQRSVNPLKAIF